MTVLRWHNLARSCCPKCGKKLGFHEGEEMLYCEDLKCGFQISQYRAERLVAQMNGKKVFADPPLDNFSALQNLGEEPEEKSSEDGDELFNRIGI